ncbi:hypothetical protein MYK68_08550 [Gordonia sp. PP30]|uniref:hypothetical protein n=1 Tax=Gordonia sp. PP30 TaxID=2935861 RepID=UPI001FFE83A2|nr:hypothetical protein [Gordonia sp. PP30]UQE76593.1 hypothetical protein MYK68_08550 [Gordonia sp. PP30]
MTDPHRRFSFAEQYDAPPTSPIPDSAQPPSGPPAGPPPDPFAAAPAHYGAGDRATAAPVRVRPGYVTASVVLQQIGNITLFVLGLLTVAAGVMWKNSPSFRASTPIQNLLQEYQDRLSGDDIESIVAIAIAIGTVLALLGLGLIVVSTAVGRGRNWARIVATIIAALLGIVGITSVLPFVWSALIVVGMWLPGTSEFFAETVTRRAPRYSGSAERPDVTNGWS